MWEKNKKKGKYIFLGEVRIFQVGGNDFNVKYLNFFLSFSIKAQGCIIELIFPHQLL